MQNPVNCMLVHPEFSKNSALNYTDVCKITGAKYPIPPLGLLTVAALLPESWNIRLVDENVEPLKEEYFQWADLIFTGGMLSQQPGICTIIRQAHQHGKKVVVGGPDPTCQPQIYAEADYLILGEGENTIPQFLYDLEKGIPEALYRSHEKADLTLSVIPRFDLISFSDYLMMGIQFSRGCPYQCEFCNVTELFGRTQRKKTVAHILDELEVLYRAGFRGHIFFVDDNFLSNGHAVVELLLALADWMAQHNHPLYFQAEASVNFACDEQLLRLMRNAGFRYVSIGFETTDDEVLEKARKSQNMHRSIPETVRLLLSYGIIPDASFILGFDNETEFTAPAMMKSIQDSGLCMAMIGTLYALPDTHLAERLKKEGRLDEVSVKIMAGSAEIDQMTGGLNFRTIRPKELILKEYIHILTYIYHPENYYERLTTMGLLLKPNTRYHPGLHQRLKTAKAFLRVCRKAGLSRNTGRLFWKLLILISIKNPQALESVISFAAMYIHLEKHARYITDLTRQKIVHA